MVSESVGCTVVLGAIVYAEAGTDWGEGGGPFGALKAVWVFLARKYLLEILCLHWRAALEVAARNRGNKERPRASFWKETGVFQTTIVKWVSRAGRRVQQTEATMVRWGSLSLSQSDFQRRMKHFVT